MGRGAALELFGFNAVQLEGSGPDDPATLALAVPPNYIPGTPVTGLLKVPQPARIPKCTMVSYYGLVFVRCQLQSSFSSLE